MPRPNRPVTATSASFPCSAPYYATLAGLSLPVQLYPTQFERKLANTPQSLVDLFPQSGYRWRIERIQEWMQQMLVDEAIGGPPS